MVARVALAENRKAAEGISVLEFRGQTTDGGARSSQQDPNHVDTDVPLGPPPMTTLQNMV